MGAGETALSDPWLSVSCPQVSFHPTAPRVQFPASCREIPDVMPGLPAGPGGSPSRCELGRLDGPAKPRLLFHPCSWTEVTFWGLQAIASPSGGISSQPGEQRPAGLGEGGSQG